MYTAKISVIIPVSNAENVVHYAIISIIEQQDLSENDLEVICVNDGSTDSSPEVLEQYRIKYPNLTVINQENKGPGGARNSGIEKAKGEYILFVDADDYLLPDKLRSLYLKAKNFDLDILEFGAEGVTPEGKIIYRKSMKGPDKPVSGEEYISIMPYMNSPCNKLYSLNLLINNNLKFLERVSAMEDIEFNMRVFLFARKVMAIPDICAHFVNRHDSITRGTDLEKQYKVMDDMLHVIPLIDDFINKNYPPDSIAIPGLKERISNLTLSLLFRAMLNAKSIQKQRKIIYELKNRGLYPVKNLSDSHNKNIFRLIANRSVLYFSFCHISNLFK